MAINYEMKSKINTYLNMGEEHIDKFHKLYEWSATALELTVQERTCKPIVREGDIFYCNFGFNVGSEIDKTRPCVVLSSDIHNSTGTTIEVAPITNNCSDFEYHILINDNIVEMRDGSDDNLTGNIKIESSRNISKARLSRKIGRLTPKGSLLVKKAILSYHNITKETIMAIMSDLSDNDFTKSEINENLSMSESEYLDQDINKDEIFNNDENYRLTHESIKYKKDQMITLKGTQLISLKGEQEVQLKDGRKVTLKNGQTIYLQEGQPIFLKEGQILPLNNAIAI